MTPSKLPGCVWRGEEGDGTSFHCFHESVSKSVTPNDCLSCPFRTESHLAAEMPVAPMTPPEPEKPETIISKVAHGAAGLAKYALGIDAASPETKQARWNICKDCEFHKLWRCQSCGCVVSAKISIASESCPENKWGKEVKNGQQVDAT